MKHCLLVLFLLPSIMVSGGADWPGFRGPTGDGQAAVKLPTTWTSQDNVLWKKPLAGKGWSSPVVSGGRVYLTTAVPLSDSEPTSYSLRLVALDVQRGNQIIDKEVFIEDGSKAPSIHSKNSHASPTPLIDQGRVFVHFGHEGTAALDLDGNLLWQNRSLRYPPRHGAGGTPILVGNSLIFSCDGDTDPFIVALDARSGNVQWQTPRETDATKKFSFSTATLIEVQGKPQVISVGSNVVCALDPNDGREIWRVRFDGYSVIPKPIFGHGLVYVCTGYNTPSLLAIRPDGKGDVTETHVAWSAKRGVPHTPSLLLVGRELYMVADKGVATCLDAVSGEIVWQERLGGDFSASPLHANGLIYFCNEEGTTTVVKAGRDFVKVAENSLGERTLASFAVVDQSLLIRGEKHLFRIGSP